MHPCLSQRASIEQSIERAVDAAADLHRLRVNMMLYLSSSLQSIARRCRAQASWRVYLPKRERISSAVTAVQGKLLLTQHAVWLLGTQVLAPAA